MITEETIRQRPSRRVGLVLLAMAALALAASLLAAKPAHAETIFSVSSTSDESDANLNDGICSDDFGACTLRAALEQANATPGADVINFNIPGTGVHTINPARGSGLPGITDRVTIDGYTQPGASPNTETQPGKTNASPKIELDGTNAGTVGLGIDAGGSGSVIKGLVINRFTDGILALDSSQNRIEGNFIGTDPSGTLDLGNRESGVDIFATNPSSTSNTVGGNNPDQRNLISGNNGIGVFIHVTNGATTSFNRVEDNLIGTKKDGTSALGNANGVSITDSANNTVSVNTIAFNSGDGVAILASPNSDKATGNLLFGNSIFSNGRLGIDLSNSGSGGREQDPKDPDTGANDLQNFPVLTSAKTTRKGTTITGTLNSTPNKSFIVQFFSNASGGDEGQKPIGQVGVSTDGSGNASFTFKPAQKVGKGQRITATATDSSALNTSEFSAAKKVVRKR